VNIMPQSNGKTSLKRIEFEYGDSSYKFALNPEQYTQSEPSRATVVQTKGGAYIEAWGAALVSIEIKGTTGFKNGTGDASNGFKKFTELRDFIRKIYKDVKPGQKINSLLKFYNYTDEDYWYVYPDKFLLDRDKSRSLLYVYDISLIGLAMIGDYDPLNPTTADTILKDTIPISPNLISSTSIDTTDTNEAYENYLAEHQSTNSSENK
jgi:hypothetical protein